MIEERVDSDTDPNRQHVWGLRYIDDLVLRDRDTTGNGTLDERLYELQDANWNVTAIVNDSGTVQQRFSYSPYGVPEFLTAAFAGSTNTKNFETLYAGYRWEDDTGLFHVRNRILNPRLGIWITRDPIGISAGPNLYQYVMSNPIAQTDPSGLITALQEQAVKQVAVKVGARGAFSMAAFVTACAAAPPCWIVVLALGLAAVSSIISELIADGTITCAGPTPIPQPKPQPKPQPGPTGPGPDRPPAPKYHYFACCAWLNVADGRIVRVDVICREPASISYCCPPWRPTFLGFDWSFSRGRSHRGPCTGRI
ncbi:MAG: RHS repeat-associated core domain-containing protein [Planctomycetota bacterium]|nr:RHS repeat-associated core domain-containing protein [Planctomycetota bacterium]